MKVDVYSKRFAQRIATMIDSQLIGYRHYYGWADEIIAEMDEPPIWVIDIAIIRYYAEAVEAVNRFVYSEPFESFDDEARSDDYVACLFLRYRSGAISWATFLAEAGSHTDSWDGRRHCSYFYIFLDQLEASNFSRELELQQSGLVFTEFAVSLAKMVPLYEMFMEHFRKYVVKHA